MKDLYKRLELPAYTSDKGRIGHAIRNSKCDTQSLDAAKIILLDDKRREYYDSTHKVVATIGTMRANLGLTDTDLWDSSSHQDFEQSTNTRRELDLLEIRAAARGSGQSRSSQRQTRHKSTSSSDTTARHGGSFIRKHKVAVSSAAVVLIATLLFAILHDFPQYHYASYVDTPDSYANFLNRFPDSGYAERAEERKFVLQDQAAWDRITRSGSPSNYREYLSDFTEGAYIQRARDEYRRMQELDWQDAIAARSVYRIERFLAKYPDSEKDDEAAFIIEQWSRDWRWVRDQDDTDDYERFLELEPSHPQAEAARARIIDLEVRQIASGDYGALPPATPVRRNAYGTTTSIRVHNDTSHTLTLRYSGPSSRRYTFAPQATQYVTLDVGAYQVAASVDAAGVQNYYGRETLSGGSYEVTYYIETSFAPGYRRR